MDNEQYKENSKKRLLNNIKKKFDTTIIGSLAAFEEEFGSEISDSEAEKMLTVGDSIKFIESKSN